MKKYILSIIVVIFALCSTNANAQFRYGATAGVSFSDLSFKQDLVGVEKMVGPSVGVVGEMIFPGVGFGIDLGLIYSQRGAKVNLGERLIWSSQGYGNEKTYLHYIEIPLHLRFKYTNLAGFEDYVAPFVFGGPSLSILVADNNIKAYEYASGSLNLTAGFGLELWRRWQISASYSWGMTYALKTTLLDNYSARNYAWDVKLAYFF